MDMDNATKSWQCIDCGFNTAPGLFSRVELSAAFAVQALEGVSQENISVEQSPTDQSEIYIVRDAVWKKAGMEPFSGCLCIGCLEKRLGRELRPRDFPRHIFNRMLPCTARLLKRRGGHWQPPVMLTRTNWP